MLITTFNVNSVRTRLHILTQWLREKQPDFLFMQETKTQDSSFPVLAFSELGYKSYFHGEKSYNGVAVLVKEGINDIDISFGFEDRQFTTRVLTLRHKGLVFFCTYVPQGKEINSPSYTEKKEFLALVRKVIEQEYKGLFLWLGDMNVAPESIDVTHPETKKHHVCFCDEIREIFAQTKAGLIDLLRKHNPSPDIYTFYDYRVKDAATRNIGWRIDHMLASEALAEYCVSCSPDIRPRTWERPSDHVPLTTEFQL